MRFKILFLTLLLFFAPVMLVKAQGPDSEVMKSEVNSFELFWPVVAGRTLGDPLYSVKKFKESIRGVLILNKTKKVDYNVLLATKRAVEVEKLASEGKTELANKTVLELEKQISKSQELVGEGLTGNVDEINNKLNNLEIFLPWLVENYQSSVNGLTEVLDRLVVLNNSI